MPTSNVNSESLVVVEALAKPVAQSEVTPSPLLQQEVADVATVAEVANPELPSQKGLNLVEMTHHDVVAAYKIFLRRKPESQMVIESRIGLSREKMLLNFITAKEFIKYPENINLILQTAREIELKSSIAEKEVAN